MHTTNDDVDFKRIEQFVDTFYRLLEPDRKQSCRWTSHFKTVIRKEYIVEYSRKWCHTTDVSRFDCSHHVTSIRASIRCNINLFSNNDNIIPVPKLTNRFTESLQPWKRRATVKSSQYNIHVAWIMFLLAHVIIKTDIIKWTYLSTTVRLQ